MDIWYWISNTSAILGILLAIPPVYAAVLYITRDRSLRKKRIEVVRNSNGFTNAALMINIRLPSIRMDVETYIRNNDALKMAGIGANIFELTHPDVIKDENVVDTNFEILKSIRMLENQLKEQGVQRVHLFYAGPAAIATMIGAELSNRFVVLCYQRPVRASASKENYVLWGMLQPL